MVLVKIMELVHINFREILINIGLSKDLDNLKEPLINMIETVWICAKI